MAADQAHLTERVRAALVNAALSAYEDAALQGLCCEGAWEAAVSAMRHLDLGAAAAAPPEDHHPVGAPGETP